MQSDYETLKSDNVKTVIVFKELLQEIRKHDGTQSDLDELAKLSRSRISLFKTQIEELTRLHLETDDVNLKQKMSEDLTAWKAQLSDNHNLFRNALLKSQLSLNQSNKEELFASNRDKAEQSETCLRLREKMSKDMTLKRSHQLTDDLLTVTRMIRDNTEKSSQTLGKLVESSEAVTNTTEELKVMGSVIGQARKILNKYGRRENTDKLLIFLGLIFFLASCCVVLRNRLLYW